jgi:hypothetical protein
MEGAECGNPTRTETPRQRFPVSGQTNACPSANAGRLAGSQMARLQLRVTFFAQGEAEKRRWCHCPGYDVDPCTPPVPDGGGSEPCVPSAFSEHRDFTNGADKPKCKPCAFESPLSLPTPGGAALVRRVGHRHASPWIGALPFGDGLQAACFGPQPSSVSPPLATSTGVPARAQAATPDKARAAFQVAAAEALR